MEDPEELEELLKEDGGSNWIESPRNPKNRDNNNRITDWLERTNNIRMLKQMAVDELIRVSRLGRPTYGRFKEYMRDTILSDRDLFFLLNDGEVDNVLKRIGANKKWFNKAMEKK